MNQYRNIDTIELYFLLAAKSMYSELLDSYHLLDPYKYTDLGMIAINSR
jgi:hypothetical protein